MPGTGKTNMLLLTIALAQHLEGTAKAVIVVPTVSVEQWAAEANRWLPGLRTQYVPKGISKAKRVDLYVKCHSWDILLVGYHVFTRDVDNISQIPYHFLIADDVDPLHNVKNATHKAFIAAAKSAERVIVSNATPTQTHLFNLYGAAVAIDAELMWGTKTAFETQYVKRDPVYITVGRNEDGTLIRQRTMPVTGYKNVDDLVAKYEPMHIRYTYEQVADTVDMPDLMATDVPLELSPRQRARYDLLQEGILALQRDTTQTPQQKFVSSLAKFTYGQQICAGLPALGEEDGKDASAKLDWVMHNLTSSLEDAKVVVYAINKGTIKALQNRLAKEGIGYATIDGSTKNKKAQQDKFWENEDCRVMILSTAGERSLNLQCASVMIMIDSQYNPARVQQLAGRLRRAGSRHKTVRVIKLYTVDTQEERVAKVLSARQSIADAVNQETDDSNLFQALSPDEILKLIRP